MEQQDCSSGGWDDDPAEEDDRMSEADVGFIGGAEESEEDVPFRLPGMATLKGALQVWTT